MQQFDEAMDNTDELEEQRIFEEYKIWKKHAPFFYDTLYSHALTWPSLTVEWMPDRNTPFNSDWTVQRLLIGTHTSNDEQNYVQIIKVKIPQESSKDCREYREGLDEAGTSSGAAAQGRIGPGAISSSGQATAAQGGGDLPKNERIQVELQINHQGEVNRARYMPQMHKIIATKTISGEVHIFDYFKHGTCPTTDEVNPDMVLLGHDREGYGLDWNPMRAGLLLSGSDDNRICVWDVNQQNQLSDTIDPILKLDNAHSQVVEDVCWNHHDENEFASVSDDKKLKIWDLRTKSNAKCIDAHVAEILSVDYSPFDQNLMITGSADKSVAVWDTRNMRTKLFSLRQHRDEVNQVKFSRHQCNLLASSSSDRRIMIWDLARCGTEQTEEEKRDGPPELVFIHGGHTSKIQDISWNLNERLMMASCSEDNILQVWQVAYEQYDQTGGNAATDNNELDNVDHME